MQQVSAAVALVSAIVAIAVTILGVRERRRAFDAQQAELERQAKQWKDEFLRSEAAKKSR